MQAFLFQFFRPANIVDVIGIPAVDHDVVFGQFRRQLGERAIHHRRRNHQPDRARLLEFGNEIVERPGSGRAFFGQRLDAGGRHVERHALVSAFH